MRKHGLLYGIFAGVLLASLQLIEYRWLLVQHSVEIFAAVVAALFAAVGIWVGNRLNPKAEPTVVVRDVVREVLVEAPTTFIQDSRQVERLGLTARELEILALIAEGLSNREIAERVHVSENTVKTHSGRVFSKLGARRRTQAVQLGKELRLIP
jgi:two-component system, NarL family, response regulator LiaR